MLINFSQELKDLAGNPIKDGEHAITLGTVVANTLVMPKERRQDPAKCYVLAMKVFGGGEHEIDQADLSLIKTELGASQY